MSAVAAARAGRVRPGAMRRTHLRGHANIARKANRGTVTPISLQPSAKANHAQAAARCRHAPWLDRNRIHASSAARQPVVLRTSTRPLIQVTASACTESDRKTAAETAAAKRLPTSARTSRETSHAFAAWKARFQRW